MSSLLRLAIVKPELAAGLAHVTQKNGLLAAAEEDRMSDLILITIVKPGLATGLHVMPQKIGFHAGRGEVAKALVTL